MKKTTWLVFGALSVGAVLAGACGGDDDGGSNDGGDGGSGGTASTTGGGTGGSGGPNTTNTTSPSTTNNTTNGATTTGAATGGSGGAAGGGGAAGDGGAGGEVPERPSCVEIPSRASGDAEDFTITSPDFDYCEPMPDETTCEGKPFPQSASPELTWTDGPEGTLSYAITVTDITILATADATDNMSYNRGYHYVIWNIPADTTSLPAGLDSGYEVPGIDGALQWAPFNDYGYMGPCANFPNPMTGEVPTTIVEDSYSFTVYALDVATLPIPATEAGGPSFPRVMDDYLKENAIAAAEYRGTSNALASEVLEGTFPPAFDLPCPSEGDAPEGCLE